MWFEPLSKWRPEQPVAGRAELLAGKYEEARSIFEAEGNLVGLGDALLLLGREQEAVACLRRAVEGEPSLVAECGLAQALVLGGEADAAVARLRRSHVDNAVIRHHLCAALLAYADQVRSVTRDDELVITSRKQIEICADVAHEVGQIAVDASHIAAAGRLRSEVAACQQWVWSKENVAIGLSLLVVVAGIAVVAIGGGTGQVLLVVAGAVLGAAALYAIVVTHRRQAWQTRATEIGNLVWRHGA